MAKSIKLKNNMYWDSTSITHNKKKLSNYMNLIGSCASFSKTNNQTLPKQVQNQILFNQTDYVDNECFELLSDGTIKVLKDISRVQVNLNIRLAEVQDKEHILYCSSTQDEGFNSSGNINQIMAMSGILSVSKNAIIRTWLYVNNDGGLVQGNSKAWCSINLCVIK